MKQATGHNNIDDLWKNLTFKIFFPLSAYYRLEVTI